MNFLRRLQRGTNWKTVFMSLSVLFVVVGALTVFTPAAHAQGVNFFGIKSIGEYMVTTTAFVANLILLFTAWCLSFAGMLLNVSINITLNIKTFVDSTPAVYEVWKAIRDISGLFIVFTLLYAAIRQILGISPPNFGDLVKNIVVAGVLINFSFFLTGVLIDTSNIVSLTIYRAMLPGQPNVDRMYENCVNSGKSVSACAAETVSIDALSKASLRDGGLSALFMQSLQIQSIYSPENLKLKESTQAWNVQIKIIILSITGALIMITAGLSFLLASAAFLVRLVILIFLLAFSPILFAASVVPNIDEYASDWKKTFQGQLIFMPAYLLLMYAALLILSKSTVFLNGATGGLWKGASMGTGGDFLPTEYIVFAINAVFVIIMINIPLLAAIKLGGASTKWINPKKFGAQGVFGYAGARTIGSAARSADKYLAKTRIFGGTTLGRDIAAATTGRMRKSSFGSDWRSADDANKADKESKVAMSSIQKTRELDKVLSDHPFGSTNPEIEKTYSDTFKKFSTKEKLALGKKKLLEPQVLSRLKKSDFEAIEKSDEFTDDEKLEIKNKRRAIFEQAISDSATDVTQRIVTKRMMKEYEGKDLGGFSKEQYAQIIEHVTEGQLKKIRDDGSTEDQDNILRAIGLATRAGARVPKEKWIRNKNADGEWGTPPITPPPLPARAAPAAPAAPTPEDSAWI